MNADGSGQTDVTNNTSVDLGPAWGSAPAPPSNRWGEEIPDPPDFFYASDVPTDVKTLHEEAITAAAREWGNFGPLENWVSGVDVAKADELADQYCSRRETREEMSKDDCLENGYTAKFLPEMAVKVSAAIRSGVPTSAAWRNGKREWGIHLFSSSYPLGYARLLGIPFADDQQTAFHEYFHAVQHAYIFTLDKDIRDDMMGPV